MFEREPITAGELMDKQFLPKPVIVEGMLPAGTYILAGTPKIGKSFLMTQLCWSVAEGIPFLGLATRKSTVLYLALEDTQERLQSRLARMFGTDWSGSEFHLLFQTFIHYYTSQLSTLSDRNIYYNEQHYKPGYVHI